MLNKHDDDAGIRTIKSEMLAEVETRLSARQYLIDNCGYTDDGDESPNKRPRHDITQDSSDQAPSSKVWECFSELLEESGASGDMGGGVEAMVDSICQSLS